MSPFSLAALGWDAAWEAAFSTFRVRGLTPGRVVLEHNHVFRVATDGQDGDLLAEIAGRVKHRAEGRHELPVVGDWVALRSGAPGTRLAVDGLLPRRTSFSRKVAGRETEQQVIAANIDVVLLVFGLDGPVRERKIERYLVPARHSGARPVVVLNKSDLSDDVPADIGEATAIAGDASVIAVSAHQPETLAPLHALIGPGVTLALLGPSGAGKSSLVNAIAGRSVLKTGAVRDRDLRGRHTSVHRQLVVLESGGCIVDTPGLRELQLWEPEEAVDLSFGEIAALADQCRFRDCRHDSEPGCAVKAAVESGELDAGRYEHYLQLQKEQQALELRRDERTILESKRQGKIGSKALKRMQRERGR
jgi:ribosome biogenesis GTPase